MRNLYVKTLRKLMFITSVAVMFSLAGPTHAQEPGSAHRLGPDGLSFSDQTEAAGLSLVHAPPLDERPARMLGGAAAGDFNNDGWVDLFVVGGGLRPDAFFINMGDGTFEDRAVEAGLADPHLGAGTAVGDYNGDGWLDLYVTSWGDPLAPTTGQHRLYRNNGDGTFTDVAVEAGVNQTAPFIRDGFGATFGDYDLDGDLDLYVGGWFRESDGNRLFRNNGDGTFTDVTAEAGLDFPEHVFGFSPCFVDMDRDAYPELLLVADIETSHYLVNNGDGTFTNYTAESGTSLEQNGMGSAVADFNNDGLPDWYVTAVHDYELAGRGPGNRLYYNLGEHQFEELAAAAGANDGGWGWGTVGVDVNHDGLVDIVETNGWIWEAYVGIMSRVWLNNGDDTFSEVAGTTGFDHTLQGRGLLSFDYDRDGDRDFVVTAWNDDLRLYRNDLAGPDTNWLQVVLDTNDVPTLAPDGYGSRLVVRIGDQELHRDVVNCSNYLTHSELTAHFGLGAAEVVDELRVEWTDGNVTIVTDIAANQTVTVSPALPLTPPRRALPVRRRNRPR